MFKFAVKLERGQVIGLGFSEGNFEQLKLHRPIKIEYSDLGIKTPGGIIVVYPSVEVDALEKRIPKVWTLIEINDDAMTYMRSGRIWTLRFAKLEAMMFWGKDEEWIRETLADIIQAPHTEDRSPSIPAGQHRHRMNPT